MLWAKNPQDRNVFWLNGLAGTGKSTIAQSLSEAVAKEELLGASFFCSRDYLDRRELKNIFPTLAYQLACHYPHFQTHIISIIKDNPTIAHTSLITQLEKLLVAPLSATNIRCVIVIDALDECIDNEPSSAILSVLGQFIKELSLVKFFITGRPEPRIRTGFRLPLLQPITQVFLLHEVDLTSVSNDIQLYLTQRLATIAAQRSDLDLPTPWPHNGEIEALTKKSSGLFIFASTMVRFIESGHHDPNQRLQLLLSEANSTMHEGRSGIDSLYSQILQYAFSDVNELEEFADIRHVLGAIVLAFNPLSRRELSTILGTSMSLISTTLRHLHSVILVPANESEKIRIFHKSFPDFLQDNRRCIDIRLHINPETHHGDMALSCLELVGELERNPCSLPPFTANQDIWDLPQLLENKLGGAVRYACTYWAGHLRLSPTSGDLAGQTIDSVTYTLKNAPAWIELMSLESQLGEVINSMNSLLDWLDKVSNC
jgi:archaellum biogenesis ATPase FlaH